MLRTGPHDEINVPEEKIADPNAHFVNVHASDDNFLEEDEDEHVESTSTPATVMPLHDPRKGGYETQI